MVEVMLKGDVSAQSFAFLRILHETQTLRPSLHPFITAVIAPCGLLCLRETQAAALSMF